MGTGIGGRARGWRCVGGRVGGRVSRLVRGAALVAVLAATAAHGQGLNMLGRQTQNEGFSAVPAPAAVTIDGSLAEWDLSGQIWSYADTSIRDSFSVKTAAMWDADNLYLGFEWRDPTPLNSTVDPAFDPERGWVADAVQLRFLAGTQPSWFTAWGFDRGTKPAVHVFYWAAENEHKQGRTVLHYTGKAGERAIGEGVESAYAALPDGKGFVHELKLPWKVVFGAEQRVSAGQSVRMGMEFLWGDSTGRTWPMHRYADNMQQGETSREFFWTAKKSWGDLELAAAGVAEPRKYVDESLAPQGTIPVRAQVPADAATFSLVIDDAEGNRVRHLAGGCGVADHTVSRTGDTAVVEVLWDGLDEAGRLAAPGSYTARGLVQNGIDGYYEMSFYNPGTPPWQTDDGRGAWGADHSVIRLLARSGTNVVMGSDFAEGGYGTFCLHPDGTKAWSEKRGAAVLAATERHVYTVPNFWEHSGTQLLRLDAQDGSFSPFVRDGKERPMPLPFADLMELPAAAAGDEAALPKARGLAAAGGMILLATDDDGLWLFDAETAAPIRRTTLPLSGVDGKYPFACDGTNVWYFRGTDLMRLGLDAVKTASDPAPAAVKVPLERGVERPGAIALDDAGNLSITDLGTDLQVKRFAADGRLLGTFGKRGGRPRQGAYDPAGMRDMAGIAMDATGRLWVAEHSHHPRRVSSWKPDGSLDREFIGNTGYAGQGSFPHDSDPTRGFAEFCEIRLDPAARSWAVESVMYNPDPARGDFVMPGSTAFGSGNVFFSAASGERHEYFVSLGELRNTPVFVMMKVGREWQPVAAIFAVARLQGLFGGMYGAQIMKDAVGDYADLDPGDMLIWNDFDNDGTIRRAECEIVPVPTKTRAADGKPAWIRTCPLPITFGGGGRVDPADFSFYGQGHLRTAADKGMFRYRPTRFRDGGRPVLATEGITRVPAEFDLMEAVPVPGQDLVVGFIQEHGKVSVAGFRKSDAAVVWRYLSPYHQVHGSHKAPMPRPGLLIGCLKIAGIVAGCGDAEHVFMIRGNLGEDYYLTTDGILVGTLTKDGRIPGIERPQTEEGLRGISFAALNGRGEHFSGLISRQADGVVRASGAIPADQACNLVRIEGLESIRRVPPATFAVTQAELVKADADNARRLLASAKRPEPYAVPPAAQDAKGRIDWNRVKPLRISREGQPATADLRAAYDADALHLSYSVNDPTPWRNSGKDFRLLFKTGDCVDFQLSPSGNTQAKAVAGDLRVVIANFTGKPVALLMQPVAADGSAADRHTYSSPVMTVPFDRVAILPGVTPEVSVRGGSYTVSVSLPWRVLGVEPKPGLTLRADAGFILSDPAGVMNVARIYWSNPNTNLVNDEPGEAILQPQAFGEWVLGGP